MIATVARDYRTVDMSVFKSDERVPVMSEAELERIKHNERYHAKLLRGIAQLKAGKGVVHELIETGDEEEYKRKLDKGREDVRNGNIIHKTLTELRALVK